MAIHSEKPMTPEREKALVAVAEAARKVGSEWWKTDDMYALRTTLRALDALPYPPPSGEIWETEAQSIADEIAHKLPERHQRQKDAMHTDIFESLAVACALRDDIRALTAAIREGKR